MNFPTEDKETFTTVVSSVNKLDASNASELKSTLLSLNKQSVNNIVFDMSKSVYCDSSGLSAILLGNRLCKDAGGKFVITNLQSNVKKLIEISQLQTVLNIAENKDEALKVLF